jgi:polar amino acid transport system substrate-binding protein
MRALGITLILVLFPFFLFAKEVSLTPDEKEWIEKAPPIRIANHIDYNPYSFFVQNEARGYLVDYIKLLASKLGAKVEFITAQKSALEAQFANGHLDAMVPVFTNEITLNEYIHTNPLAVVKFSFVTRKSEASIKALEDLRGKTLAVVKDWRRMRFVQEHYPQIKIVSYPTSKDALEAVAFGLADASIEDFFVANYIMKRYVLGNLHTVNQSKCDTSSDDTLRIGFANHAKEWVRLFNKAINAVSEDEHYALSQKWFEYLQNTPPASLLLSSQERQHLDNLGKVRMCIDPDWMPLESIYNGEHIGMSRDYMDLIEEKIGIPIEMIPTKTWLESIEKAKSRECDIYSLAMPTPERKLYMNFTEPYLRVPLVLVTRPDELFFSDISLIHDEKIGIVKGYAYGEILRVKYPQMDFVEVENVNEGLLGVHNKKLFGFIGTLATVGYAIQKEYTGQLKITGKFDEFWELGVGVRNDDLLLLSVFEKAIASINPSAHQQILNKWISVQYEKEVDYTLLFQVLGVVALMLIYFLNRQRELKRYNAKLEILSTTDALTGIYNRLKLDEILSHEWRNFAKYGCKCSIIIMDIDDFKQVNDKFGHKAGDRVLKMIAQIILKNKRESDLFGRWGGEEFMLLCKEADKEGAQIVAKKIQCAISENDFGEIGPQTLSYGIAQFQQNDNLDGVFIRADNALYRAKTSGKNMICVG